MGDQKVVVVGWLVKSFESHLAHYHNLDHQEFVSPSNSKLVNFLGP